MKPRFLPIIAFTIVCIPISLNSPTSVHSIAPSTFELEAHVLSCDASSFEGFYLLSYHIYPDGSYAVLRALSSKNPDITGYLNGTVEELAHQEGDLIFAGSQYPYGFVIDTLNATYNPIFINVGSGTKGSFVEHGILE